MSLVWEDHFDGDSLNASRWRVLEQVHRGGVYAKENVQVADGVLTLLTVPHNLTIDQGGQPTTFYVSSGAVNTSGLLEQRHGRWEVRVKLPAVALSRGYTLHSSIWLFADARNPARTGCPQEIDVVEQYTAGDSNVSNAVANIHPFSGCASVGHAAGCAHAVGSGTCAKVPYARPRSTTARGDWTTDWTVFIVDWTESWIGMRVNGVPYAAFEPAAGNASATAAFTDELFLALTSCVMDRVPVGEADVFPLRYEIDYVKVYEFGSRQ